MNFENPNKMNTSPLDTLSKAISALKANMTAEGNIDEEFSSLNAIIPRIENNMITLEEGQKEFQKILDKRNPR